MTGAAGRPEADPDLTVQAPAKVNLFLEVLGRRPDGYHEIETIMQAVDLSDTLEFWLRPAGTVTISVSGGPAPADGSNLAVRAALALAEAAGLSAGLHLHIHKRIPAGGGLGGGSSDAAATLSALNRLWRAGASPGDLSALAAKLGSDVPFFLVGGTAVCRGRGEIVESIACNIPSMYLLCVPQIHVATKDIYAGLQERSLTERKHDSSCMRRMLERGEVHGVAAGLFNRLEESAFAAYPELSAIKDRLAEERVLGRLMSGSGATVFAMTGTADAGTVAGILQPRFPNERLIPVRPLPAPG